MAFKQGCHNITFSLHNYRGQKEFMIMILKWYPQRIFKEMLCVILIFNFVYCAFCIFLGKWITLKHQVQGSEREFVRTSVLKRTKRTISGYELRVQRWHSFSWHVELCCQSSKIPFEFYSLRYIIFNIGIIFQLYN